MVSAVDTPSRRLDRDAKRAALLASPLFQAMAPAELDEILGFAADRVVPRGTLIFQKGDAGTSLMAVLRGRVRASAMSPEGRELTLNVFSPGEFFGEIALLDGKPRSADVTAIDDSQLLVVERRQFLPFLARHEGLYLRMLAVLCDRLRRTSLALEDIALFELPARLARLLTKLAADYGRPIPGGGAKGLRIDIKLSDRDLATLVASSRESVNKQLAHWKDAGILTKDGRHLILLRPDMLAALSE